MNWLEFRNAWNDANQTVDMANDIAKDMGIMLVGRLRKCDASTLCALKRELRDFNMTTFE